MARTDNLTNFLTDVADSIREKKGTSEKILASKFDEEITSIETGSDPVLQSKIVSPSTSIKTIRPDDGYDALSFVTISPVTKEIDTNIQDLNIRKGITILGVEGILEEGETPTGTIDITANGTYDVKDYANAMVQVGENAVTKGFVINTFNSSGYPVDVTIVGWITTPARYFSGIDSTQNNQNAMTRYLTTVSSDSITTINSYSFNRCFALKTVTMPNVTKINSNAFNECTSLTSVEFSNNLTTISNGVFAGCSSLLLNTLPEALTSLGSSSFWGCSKITIKEIPAGVTSISSSCFENCTNITELTIKGDITGIQGSAFYGSSLTKLILPNITSVPTLGTSALSSTPIARGTGYIYVPDALIENIKVASNWSTYATQIKGLSEM